MIAHETRRFPGAPSETIFAMVARLARAASNRQLATLLVITIIGGAVLLAVLPSLWQIAALAGALASIACWGMLAHRTKVLPSPVLTLVQRFLVVVSFALALVAAFAAWFVLLGPRWML
jgi:hypothetical protein